MGWGIFGLSSIVVILAASRLSHHAEQIAARTGIGEVWIGGTLLAAATSLPELVVNVSSSLIGAPDLATGNVLGSNLFNIVVLAIANFFVLRGSIIRKTSRSHLFSIGLVMLMTLWVLLGIIFSAPIVLWGLGLDSVALLITYFAGSYLLYQRESRAGANPAELSQATARETRDTGGQTPNTLTDSYFRFAAAAILILIAGSALTSSAETIGANTGLEQSFIGSLLVALATSLPELTTVIVTVRFGAFDLAMGNVLGSNLFNLMILSVADVFYPAAAITSAGSPVHAVTAVAGMLLISLIGVCIVRPTGSFRGYGYDSMLILVLYLVTAYLIFQWG